ncbi:MAG: substrate-binding domain-containing protein [Actinomycetota bacterium]
MRKTLVIPAIVVMAISALVGAAGCGRSAPTTVVLATTTSTQDSGLLDKLLPTFEKEFNHTVKTVAVGSGEAIKMGRSGDADVVLAHDQAAEEKFVDEGYGLQRVKVMYNDFIILGPENDPAGIKGEKSASDAFKRIADAAAAGKTSFASRADGSGTNVAEMNLWKKAGVDPEGQSWYIATGQGMGETLKIADEKQSYTLADRATYITRQGNRLVILSEGDPALYNQYGVEVVNPEKHPDLDLNVQGAGDFVGFLTSEEGQKMIGEYELEGVVLFHPNAAGETRGMGDYQE